jgi:hypothetical protein
MSARDYDHPLAETQIIWDAPENPELPPVELVRLGFEDDDRYTSSWGACSHDFNDASPSEKLHMLLRQFVHLTAIEGISPKDVHRALMQIPEYRQALAEHGSIDPESV